MEPLCRECPEDASALARCRLRLVTGEQVPLTEAAERLEELREGLVLCPCVVPHGKGSGVRSIFREVVDFMVYSWGVEWPSGVKSRSFGAVNTTSPSLHGGEALVSGRKKGLLAGGGAEELDHGAQHHAFAGAATGARPLLCL